MYDNLYGASLINTRRDAELNRRAERRRVALERIAEQRQLPVRRSLAARIATTLHALVSRVRAWRMRQHTTRHI